MDKNYNTIQPLSQSDLYFVPRRRLDKMLVNSKALDEDIKGDLAYELLLRHKTQDRIRNFKKDMPVYTSFDIARYIEESEDVLETKEDKATLVKVLRGALEWANRDFRKEFAKLKKLEEEYHTHRMNIDILRGNIKTIEENIDVIKKRIREFDNEEKKDGRVQ